MIRTSFLTLGAARTFAAGALLACAGLAISSGCANREKPAPATTRAAARPATMPARVAARPATAPAAPAPVAVRPVSVKEHHMNNVTRASFGATRDGQKVDVYTLTNKNGLVARIMTYGATLTELHVPDRAGNMGDVVLGFSTLAEYEAKSPFFGATTGRVANRIAGGSFDLEGDTYQLAINNGPNTLHGGKVGFDKKIWEAHELDSPEGPAVRFHYVSPDMEENFPGALDVTVTYTLTNQDELRIDYRATTDKTTIVNLTNHSYWNLSAMLQPTILDEIMMINADQFTPVDETLIPTGRLHKVFKTPFDFTVPTRIGERIKQVPGGPPVGYDHNYVLNGAPGTLRLCARAYEPESGRQMDVWTTEPGVQFYTGNFLDGSFSGKGGNVYRQYAGFCLETQHFPDSIHHPEFPSTVLKPGQVYRQTTLHKFITRSN